MAFFARVCLGVYQVYDILFCRRRYEIIRHDTILVLPTGYVRAPSRPSMNHAHTMGVDANSKVRRTKFQLVGSTTGVTGKEKGKEMGHSIL